MSTRRDLLESDLKFLIFGGKGGTGKTTCAAATGLAMSNHGRKTLVYSVDRAHSLSDSFNQTIGNKVTKIDKVDNLYALETSAQQLFEDLKGQYREAIEEAFNQVLRGVDLPFEREFMRDIMDLAPPGLDELMALSKLNDIIKTRNYDLIVIDTAAGAHTIRLLQLPQLVEEWIEKALQLHDQYRFIMPLEECRSIIESLREDIATLRQSLVNPLQTVFIPVTIPETMGIYVTEDITKSLRALGIPYKSIIVNYVIPTHVKCDFCTRRRKEQIKRIAEIKQKFRGCTIIEAPLFLEQIRGLESLTNFAETLFEGKHELGSTRLRRGTPTYDLLHNDEKPGLDLSLENIRLVLFGGKGGCGKTTCSAATGVYAAKHGVKTLVLSTDPQRSLSDVFDQPIREDVTPIKGVDGLYALELDAEKLLKAFKNEHREEIMEIVTEATYLDKEDLGEFFELSLPGMDEVTAMVKLIDLTETEGYDLLILDTAPTGHTLRFLELPDMMSKWVKVLFKMRSKAQYIVHTFFGRSMRARSDLFLQKTLNDVRKIKATLSSRKTVFIPVTTLDEMATKESERLIATLRSYKIPIDQLIINRLAPANYDCDYCASKAQAERRVLQDFQKELPDIRFVKIPLFPDEVRGIDKLEDFTKVLFREEGMI